MDAPRIAVIVVLHDSARYVERCLRSVLAQDVDGLEIVVVDNASADDGPARVEAAFPGVRVIRSPENLGYAGGINLGGAATDAPLLAPLNADTEVAPGWLRAMRGHLLAHPEVGAVTPLLLIDQDRARVNALGGAIHPSGLSFCNGLGRRRDQVPAAPFSVPGVSGASFLLRRETLEAVGGAPQWCFMGNDDVVLSWLIRLRGLDIVCVPEAVVHHRYNLSVDPHKIYLVERNRWRLLLTALQGPTLVQRLPRHLVLEMLIFMWCAARGPAFLGAKARAVRDALADPAALRQMRRQIQAMRRVDDAPVLAALATDLAWDQLGALLYRREARRESLAV